jgi:hypothetical protein
MAEVPFVVIADRLLKRTVADMVGGEPCILGIALVLALRSEDADLVFAERWVLNVQQANPILLIVRDCLKVEGVIGLEANRGPQTCVAIVVHVAYAPDDIVDPAGLIPVVSRNPEGRVVPYRQVGDSVEGARPAAVVRI